MVIILTPENWFGIQCNFFHLKYSDRPVVKKSYIGNLHRQHEADESSTYIYTP